MRDHLSEEAAAQIAREMASRGIPSDEIILHLVARGLDRGMAVSVVFRHTSATRSPHQRTGRPETLGEKLDEERTVAAFRRRWNRQIVASALAVGFVLLAVLGKAIREGEFLGLTGQDLMQLSLAGVCGVLIFSYFNYRCPACKAYLGRAISPAYCPSCGVRLD